MTPLQQRLADLIASGHSLDGAALARSAGSKSAKSVAYALWHVYQRYGVHNRYELAAALGSPRNESTRWCPRCKRTKLRSEFPSSVRYCRICFNIYQRNRKRKSKLAVWMQGQIEIQCRIIRTVSGRYHILANGNQFVVDADQVRRVKT